MTVAELIKQLKKLPKNATVQLYTYDDYQDDPVMYMDLMNVRVGKNDDPKNDQTVVRLSY